MSIKFLICWRWQVFSASNVELVTKTRVEHLTDHDKKKEKKSRTPLESFLGIAEQQEKIEGAAANGVRICFYLSYIMNTDSRF